MFPRIALLVALAIGLSPQSLHGQQKIEGITRIILPKGAPKPRTACKVLALEQQDLARALCDQGTIEMLLDLSYGQQTRPNVVEIQALALIHYLPGRSIHGWIDVTFPLSGTASGVHQRIDQQKEFDDALLAGYKKRDLMMATPKRLRR